MMHHAVQPPRFATPHPDAQPVLQPAIFPIANEAGRLGDTLKVKERSILPFSPGTPASMEKLDMSGMLAATLVKA